MERSVNRVDGSRKRIDSALERTQAYEISRWQD